MSMISRLAGRLSLLAAAAALLAAAAAPASAHPHIFVTHKASIAFDKGAIVGIDHVWFFDEFYSAMAVEGLDTNKDGKLSREELHELAKTNIEGLKDFDYFTKATLAGKELKVADPSDYWLEHKDGVLSLHFRSPLVEPVPANQKGFAFSIYDPSFLIAFDLVEKDPVALGDGAPAQCKVSVGVPEAEAEQNKQLNGAFGSQLGSGGLGLGVTKTVTVDCSGP